MESKVSYQKLFIILSLYRIKVFTAANIMMVWIILWFYSKDQTLFISGRWLTLKPKRMDLIDPFTGSKRSQDKRMAQSKGSSGQSLLDISVIGGITAKRDLVSNFTRMAISTKECGPWTKSMVKEHTGEMKTLSSEENTLEIGLKTKNMVEALSSLRIQTDTMDIG